MDNQSYSEFLNSDDTLQVYAGNKLVFSSKKEGLIALLDYLEGFSTARRRVTILDKVTGNASALLIIKAAGRQVYSPLGSQLALKTLTSYGIRHHFDVTVPYIRQEGSEKMCPMEKLSLDKDPEEFHAALTAIMSRPPQP